MYRRREILQPGRVSPTAPGGYWLHVSRPAMACRFEVTLPDEVETGVREASLALDEVGRLESQLSIFRGESEITRINRLAGKGPVEIDPDIFDLLVRCQDLSRVTEGAFDITTGPLSRIWGFTRRAGRIPSREELEFALSCVGMDRLILARETRTVTFGDEGMEINSGGIGKGYALDQVAARLRRHKIPALISAGYSSMLALGQIWTVGVRDPRYPIESGRRLAVIRMRDLALGTSGSEEQSFEFQGVRYGHIIDPRTGWPALAGLGVTVIAPSAELADGLATAFYIGGARMARQYCEGHAGVVVVMLEEGTARPLVIGSHPQCEVTAFNQ